MDLEDLQRAARAAREFTHTEAHVTFTLLVPTPHEAEVAAMRNSFVAVGRPDHASLVRTQRALVEQAVTGWQGLTVGDVLAESPQAADSLPFEPGATGLVLDAQPGWALALWEQLLQRIEARNALRSTAAKN
jgi:hypothetical protein